MSNVGSKFLFIILFINPWLVSTNLFLAISICAGVDSLDFIVLINSSLVSDICLFFSVTLSVISSIWSSIFFNLVLPLLVFVFKSSCLCDSKAFTAALSNLSVNSGSISFSSWKSFDLLSIILATSGSLSTSIIKSSSGVLNSFNSKACSLVIGSPFIL